MKKTMIMFVAALAALSTTAFANDEYSLSADVALTSDYRFRGVSVSDEDPAVQAGIQVDHMSGFYGGVWASQADLYGGAVKYEVDYYFGYTDAINESDVWTYDVGYIYYTYPGIDDYGELYGIVTATYTAWDMPAEGSIGVAYTDDYAGVGAEQTYVSLDYTLGIHEHVNLDLHLGGSRFDTQDDTYLDWSVGFSTEVKGADVSIAYVDTDLSGVSGAGSTVIGTISYSF